MSANDRRDTLNAEGALERFLDMLKKRERSLRLDLRVAMPAKVTGINPAAQTVDLVLGFLPVRDVDAAEVVLPPIPIPNVKIGWPQTATSWHVHPVAVNDTGFVIFMDRALETWRNGDGSPADPIDGRTHDLADAVFFPMLAPTSGAITPTPTPGAQVLEAPLIHLGSGATEPVALGTTLVNDLSTYLGVWAGITPGTAVQNAAALTSIKTAAGILLASLANWLSTKVMTE